VAAGCRGVTAAVATERGAGGAGRGGAISSRTGSSTLSSPLEPMAKRLSPSADNTCAASALSSAIVSAVATVESPSQPVSEKTARHTRATLRKTPDIRDTPFEGDQKDCCFNRATPDTLVLRVDLGDDQDPVGCRCTGPRFTVLSCGFRVLPPVTHDTGLGTEDPCTDNRPGLVTR
jgi:hypothetical protein